MSKVFTEEPDDCGSVMMMTGNGLDIFHSYDADSPVYLKPRNEDVWIQVKDLKGLANSLLAINASRPSTDRWDVV